MHKPKVFGAAHGISAAAHGGFAPVHGISGAVHGGFAPAHGISAAAHGGFAPAHGISAAAHGGFAPAHGISSAAHGGFAPAPDLENEHPILWLGHADARQVSDLPARNLPRCQRSMTAGRRPAEGNKAVWPASLRLAAHRHGQAMGDRIRPSIRFY